MATATDALAAYRGKLASCAPLDENTEREMALAWKNGDRRAGEKLVCACLPFVVSVAMEYRRWGVPMEDIIQQGNIGLLRAAGRFDTSKSCRLITYAAYWIRAEIREYLVRSYRVVRLGTTKAERRALRLYRSTREDNPSELAARSGLTEEKARNLLPLLAARDISLDAESSSTGSTVLDRLASATMSPEEETSKIEGNSKARSALDEVLSTLSDRERLIIRQRWVEDEPQTLEQLGKELGVSKERVRQLEERARAKLRARLEEKGYAGAA
ncbi:MAG: sigma-70 family RNA polymerase sigma factor [Polyangiaceae bacterium]